MMTSVEIHSANTGGGKTRVILFADVVGYSALMHQDEADTYRRVTRSVALIRDLIGDYGGNVVQIVGDGILSMFDSANEALRFAVAVQKEFRNDRVWNAGRPPIVFRIGISLGEVISGDGTLHGHSVNLATRLQGLAKPGGICVTGMVRQAIRDQTGLLVESLGRPHMDDIAEPPEVFSVTLYADPVAAALKPAHAPARDRVTRVPELEGASVAVLPLDNLSRDPGDAHLCDGIATDIISNLCRFRNLLVIARQSSFAVQTQSASLRAIGEQLGARYLLSGGLRRAGNKLRINVDLVEADSQTTIWSECYDGQLGDMFEFQDDVAACTAARVAVQIDTATRRGMYADWQPDLRAYGLILRGEDLTHKFLPQNYAHARRLFQQACELDPDYGRGYAAVSRTYNMEWRYHWTDTPDRSLDRALELARAAVQRDSLDARGYAEIGLASLYKKEHVEAIAAYEHALELNPNDADLLAETGDCLVYSREAQRSVELIHKAMRLNPYHPDMYFVFLADAYFHLGDYPKTIATVERMSDQSEGHRLMAASHALLGQMEQARHHAAQVLRAHPNFSIAHWRTVPPNRYPEDLEIFLEGLRKAGLK